MIVQRKYIEADDADRLLSLDDAQAIATLPVDAFEPLGIALGNAVTQGSAPSNLHTTTAHVSRDEPFPCFKKTRWSEHGTAMVIVRS